MEEKRREMNLFEMLTAFFRWIKQLFVSLFRLLGEILRLTVHYYWLVLIVMGLTIAVGFYFTQQSKRIYKAKVTMIFSPDVREYIKDGLDHFFTARNFDTDRLASTMEVDKGWLSKIRKMRYFPIIDLKNDSVPDFTDRNNSAVFATDTFNVVMLDRLALDVELKGEYYLKPLTDGLPRYFASMPELMRADSAGKQHIYDRIAFCDRELLRLDSLSNYDYFHESRLTLNVNKKDVRLEPSRESLYYANMRDLLREKHQLTMQLAKSPNVVNFTTTPPTLDVYPRSYSMLIAAAIGYVLGVLCAWAFKRRKNIRAYFSK